jgi:hypothetical protein
MAVLGVLLMPHKRERVLSREVLDALQAGDARAVLLLPDDTSSWAQADAILHKMPGDQGGCKPCWYVKC